MVEVGKKGSCLLFVVVASGEEVGKKRSTWAMRWAGAVKKRVFRGLFDEGKEIKQRGGEGVVI